MSGKVIGQRFNNGFAGSYARLPEMHIYTKPNTGDASNVLLWTILLIVSGGMTAKISVSRKRKQEER